jgi:uncharacterized FlgJ-related protein
MEVEVIYRGVAYLESSAGSNKFAENNQLFVTKATGNSSSIINQGGFKPKKF